MASKRRLKRQEKRYEDAERCWRTGKIRHQQKIGATLQIAQLRTRRYCQDGDLLREYYCSHCHGWHSGHSLDILYVSDPKHMK